MPSLFSSYALPADRCCFRCEQCNYSIPRRWRSVFRLCKVQIIRSTLRNTRTRTRTAFFAPIRKQTSAHNRCNINYMAACIHGIKTEITHRIANFTHTHRQPSPHHMCRCVSPAEYNADVSLSLHIHRRMSAGPARLYRVPSNAAFTWFNIEIIQCRFVPAAASQLNCIVFIQLCISVRMAYDWNDISLQSEIALVLAHLRIDRQHVRHHNSLLQTIPLLVVMHFVMRQLICELIRFHTLTHIGIDMPLVELG